MFGKKSLVLLFTVSLILVTVAVQCGPAPTPEVVEKVVKETVVVKEEVEVTKVVEVEKEVEVVVTPTPTEPPPPPPDMPPPEEGLVTTLSTEPPTLDVNLGTDTTSHAILNQIMESPYRYMEDGSIEPAGAVSYEVSEDGRVYTIMLREDAVWHDGEPVVAQHYVDGITRLLMPETAAEYAWLMYFVEGAEELNTADETTPELKEGLAVKAADDYILEITLKEPLAFFPSILAFSTCYPVRLDLIEQYGDEWFEAGNFVGNGPYMLTSWEHEAEVILEKFDDYHDADQVSIEKIIFYVVPEEATALAMYEAGETHLAGFAYGGFPAAELPRILEDPKLSQEFRKIVRPGTYYVGLNTLRPPTDDPLVRKALSAAVDRRTLLDEVLSMPWREDSGGIIPVGIPGFQGTEIGYPFDLEQAKKFLADAGYPEGEGFPMLDVWYNKSADNTLILEAVTAMWEQNLGISVRLTNMEWKVYLDILDECNTPPMTPAECEFNVYRMGWVMDYADPNNILNEVFAPASPFQYTGWESERYSELMEMALKETDMDKRVEYYKEADKIAAEDECMAIPLFYYDYQRLAKPALEYWFPPFGSGHVMKWRFK